MPKFFLLSLMSVCLLGSTPAQAQQRSSTLLQPLLDERILIITDKPLYFPDDTIRLIIQREDSDTGATVTPLIAINGLQLLPTGQDSYIGFIPPSVTPGSYRIFLKIVPVGGLRFVYDTGRVVEVEEYQAIQQLSDYVRVVPPVGSSDPQMAGTLDGDQVRALRVLFCRDSIHARMGPQFVTIRTTVQLRDGAIMQMAERRVMTFRSHGTPERDRTMFIQYRRAYGAYAALSKDELTEVQLPLDSLPPWSTIKVNIEPDYTITIGAIDRSNSMTRYFRVRGPALEIGISLGIPKVLFDTQARDTVEYGNTSAMVRFYYINPQSGNRFPVSFGAGTFGVNSPIDVGVRRGGFALSTFLDLVELTRIRDIGFLKKVNAGLEATLFFPVERKGRLLLNAQVAFSP
jgi:hypothetical protein